MSDGQWATDRLRLENDRLRADRVRLNRLTVDLHREVGLLKAALAEADADRLVKQARIEELERALGLSSTVTVPPLPYFHEPPEGPVP